jgi:hypothetical protein
MPCNGECPAANPVACLQNHDVASGLYELAGRGQTGKASADDKDVNRSLCGAGRKVF